jgi:ubiquinone/menaquinone biosynthesis C-methylase UbiE
MEWILAGDALFQSVWRPILVNMDPAERKRLEIAHQARAAARAAEIQPTPGFIVERFGASKLWRQFPKEYIFRRLVPFKDKQILDFGCGDGEISTQLALLGARVTGIDISPELIEMAHHRAALDHVEDRTRFIAGDIVTLDLEPNAFDHVVCYAVLHHVDMDETLPRILRCLKPGGTALMVEPTAFSPTLQRIRDVTPVQKDTSPVERQLGASDIKHISSFFARCDVTYFEMLGRLQRLFPNRDKIDRGHPFTKSALVTMHSVDRFFVSAFPFLWRYYGTAVMEGQKAA